MDCKNKTPDNQKFPVGPSKPQIPQTRLMGFLEMMVAVAKSGAPIPIHRGARFACMEELVVQSGRGFLSPQVVHPWKNPFEQALLVAMADMDAVYCEGFALFEGQPIPQLTAWAVQDGHLLVPAKGEFIGVAFDTLYACARLLQSTNAGILISDEQSEKSLLDTGFPRGALVRIKSQPKKR